MTINSRPSHRLNRWLLAIRRLWIFCLLLLLGGAGAGYFAGLQAPQVNTATSVILVAPLEGNPFYPSARGEQLVNLITEAQIIKSDAVVSQVIEATGLNDTPAELRQNVSTNVPVNTQLIEITVADADKDKAARTAQSFAEAYLEFRSGQADSSLQGQVAGIQDEIERLDADLAKKTTLLNAKSTPAVEKTVLQAQLQAGADQIAALGARMSSLSTTLVDPGQIVTPAMADPASLLGPPLLGAFGGACATAAVCAGLLWLVVRRGRIRTTHELQRLELNPMHVVASSPARAVGGRKANSFPAFRSRLTGLLRQSENRVLMLVPVEAEQDFPHSSIAVAEALSDARYRTLLIDTTGLVLDPEDSAFPKAGFGEVLSGSIALTRAVERRDEHLHVLSAGSWLHGLEHSLDERALVQLLAEAKSRYDAVLIVAADPHSSAVQWLLSSVRSVLLEVRLRKTRQSDLDAVHQICEDLRVRVQATLICPEHAPRWSQSGGHTADLVLDIDPDGVAEISSGKIG